MLDMLEKWRKYVEVDQTNKIVHLGGKGQIYKMPMCGNCKHWYVLNEEDLKTVEPRQQEQISKGFEGLLIRSSPVADEVYTTHLFFGWCKRFPPIHRTEHSTKPFLSRLITRIPMRIADYDFPIMSHENKCGEWSGQEWYLNPEE